jgi:hypothetical protein
MKVIITRTSPVHPNHRTISIFDDDGREITVRQGHIPNLKKLLTAIRHEWQTGAGWETETSAYDSKIQQITDKGTR